MISHNSDRHDARRLARAGRQALVRIASRSGWLATAAKSRWRSARLLVLCFHGVSTFDEHEWDPALYLSPAVFARRLALLRESGCSPLPLDEGLRRLAAGTLPPCAVALTFDDGAQDFYAAARGPLYQHGLPATVYVSTYYSDHQLPVFDTACSYLCWHAAQRGIGSVEVTLGAERTTLPTSTAPAVLRRSAAELNLSAVQKDDLLAELAERTGFDWQALRRRRLLHLMNAEELREVSAEGVDLQLHTHRHRSPVDRDALLKEIEDNRRALCASIGRPREFVHFCYPSGEHYPIQRSWLASAGIQSASTCESAMVEARTDLLAFPRFVVTTGVPEVDYTAWLTGFTPRVLGYLGRGRA